MKEGRPTAKRMAVSRATLRDLDEIVALLQANEAPRGTLTGHFTAARVRTAIQAMPVVVARLDGRVAGVLLSSPIEAARGEPALEGMVAVYRGEPGAYIYGPICVAESARGLGLTRLLFERLRGELTGREGILFVRKDNDASLKAHRRLPGMQVRGEFSVEDMTFVVFSFAGS